MAAESIAEYQRRDTYWQRRTSELQLRVNDLERLVDDLFAFMPVEARVRYDEWVRNGRPE